MTSSEDYRAQVRRTMQAFSDEALAFQDARIIGGIDREECDREKVRRHDPLLFSVIEEHGRYCPCGIDLYRNGCYRCLKERGATWTCDPAVEATWHGRANPHLSAWRYPR